MSVIQKKNENMKQIEYLKKMKTAKLLSKTLVDRVVLSFFLFLDCSFILFFSNLSLQNVLFAYNNNGTKLLHA